MKSRTALLGLSPSTPSCSLSATTAHFNLQGYLLEHTHLLLFSSKSPPCAAKPSCTSARAWLQGWSQHTA